MASESHPLKVVSSGYRTIKDGSRYSSYFPLPEERDRIIIKDGEVNDTVELMERVVWKYLDDTKQLAPLLSRSSTLETCRAVWDFIYSYIQYRLDKKGLEQLRRPARSWAERQSGVDCDCMSIFASSILTNLQIPHSFRITKYSGDSWQHVYVIVPDKTTGKYITLDGVVSEFNYEKHFSDKMDYPMNLKGINVAVLSGMAGNDLHDAVMATSLLGEIGEVELESIYQNLISTRRAIAQNPSVVASSDDPQALLKMLDYAIAYWNTDKRDQALDILSKNEQALNLHNGLSSIDGIDLDPDLFTLSGTAPKKFFTNVKQTVKKVTQKAGQAANQAVKAVVKYNPVSVAARSGFLLALRLNLGKMASRLKWGYATAAQAASKGVNADTYNKSRHALAQIEKLFADKLQGSKDSLRNAILKGRAGNLAGYIEDAMIGGLGDPASGTVIAAATPIIIAAIKILKDSGLIGKSENLDPNQMAKEASSDPGAAQENAAIDAENNNASAPAAPSTPSTSNSANEQVPGNVLPTEQGTDAPATPTAAGGGLMNFIKQNPVPVAIGGGLLAFGIYQLTKPKKSSSKSKGLSECRTS